MRAAGCRPPAPLRRTHHRPAAGESEPGEASPAVLVLSLRTREARASLRFAEARVLGETPPLSCVVVSAVAVESEAAAAGVQPGQRVLAVSDPVRAGELWELGSQSSPSSRSVRDALRYRVGSRFEMQLQARAYEAEELEVLTPGEAKEGEPAPLEDVSKRRNVRRAARLNQVSQRNDSGFFGGLALAVLAVPVTVLAVAWTNGWLFNAL